MPMPVTISNAGPPVSVPTGSPLTFVLGSGVGASVSSGTAEVQLASIAVPAGAMGTTGALRILCFWSHTNSGNNKVLRVRFSGSGGTTFGTSTATTTVFTQSLTIIRNAGAANSQRSQSTGTFIIPYGASAGAVLTGAIDTSVATTVYISGQPATGGETITLEHYTVELIPGV
jgi:hypothetical protein